MKKHPKAKAITLQTVLQHVQHLHGIVMREIQSIRTELMTEIQAVNQRAEHRHSIVMTALQNIDERLDDLEVRRIPAIEAKVGLPAEA